MRGAGVTSRKNVSGRFFSGQLGLSPEDPVTNVLWRWERGGLCASWLQTPHRHTHLTDIHTHHRRIASTKTFVVQHSEISFHLSRPPGSVGWRLAAGGPVTRPYVRETVLTCLWVRSWVAGRYIFPSPGVSSHSPYHTEPFSSPHNEYSLFPRPIPDSQGPYGPYLRPCLSPGLPWGPQGRPRPAHCLHL